MSTGRQTVRDLIEEAKKRMVLLIVCVVGLSYLMSLTSSSVWINLPAAASLIFLLRYISVDLDMKRKAAAYNNSPTISRILKQPQEGLKVGSVDKSNWRRKVNSPIVEAAIDQFANHLITEWVTDLWYSKLTPDKDGPEELVQIINNVLGEISCRAREINLIDLLTRDVINVICAQLELSRLSQAKIEEQSGNLTIDQRDAKLKLVLAAENKLHPALFSAQSEHRVLQHLMEGLISFTFKPADLQCSFFRYIVRELLACAVIRPVMNLPNPRFINEKIESLVISRKADKGVTSSEQEPYRQKPQGSSKASDNLSRFLDQSMKGVELVQFQHDKELDKAGVKGNTFQKDPLLSVDPHSSRSWNSFPSHSQVDGGKDLQRHHSGGEWGQMLDIMSHRKTQALAPENFENMWTKGRNYRKKEGDTQSAKQAGNSLLNGNHGTGNGDHSKGSSKRTLKNKTADIDISKRDSLLPQQENQSKAEGFCVHNGGSSLVHPPDTIYEEENEQDLICLKEVEADGESSYTTEDDETSGVTGLDSPGTKVWDSKNNRHAAVSHIRHPLESSEGHMAKKIGKGHVKYRRAPRTQLGRRRSKLSSERVPTWQEVERTSFLLGDGHDILNASKGDLKAEESSDDPELEIWGRAHTGAAASSSASTFPVSDIRNSSLNSVAENSVLEDSFLTLRCEVFGANIVKSGSKTFAVYSISVTDADNKSWSIKRRFRHFEELHRRLKEFPEYKLSLPPKHFLSSGLDVTVIQERCQLLDKYLKKLLQLPTISASIEVWDFLSVDSQTYMFSNSLSIIQPLSVDLESKPYEKSTKVQSSVDAAKDNSSREEYLNKSRGTSLQMKHNSAEDTSRSKTKNTIDSSVKLPIKDFQYISEDSGSDSDSREGRSTLSDRNSVKSLDERGNDGVQEAKESSLDVANDPPLPTEWVPPNLSVPLLDLVDVVFQLQDGGWIRRQAFWVAKQVLQLGMGDAFDDWLIDKIQLLRRGSVIASAIKRVEQILWPDGIFITKHPKRQRPPQPVNQNQSPQLEAANISSTKRENAQKPPEKDNNILTDEQQREEAARRAKFVYELMIDNAPAALVGLFGRKEYEKSAKDLYFFLQSSVCLKQLAFNILELLLLSAFPELDDVVKMLHEEKHKFGEVEAG
ncbi:hypothetical protein AQUCO_00100467v1 [Aquilegia coerulea]|uniref:PXA domain-containing protein n=1 Tax=Aquilegia coerulea TaxID=218851 RepID=A0A2G5FAJ0_AQUCA|nr:hypothetical protein AQUCO_00100467v1 [Aquilegia coerulea]